MRGHDAALVHLGCREEQKKDEKKRREEEHQKLVGRLISRVEGAGFLYRTTKSVAWRGCLQVLEELRGRCLTHEECEEKRKEWAKQSLCDSEVQGVEDKPWKNEELRSLEEGLPRLKEERE